ncbi:MAG: hypothetical protein KF773_30515 [Deltaproteobacteria bacterium]|nr:hypothetical protein [Deltaproteobacteria bacterium]
MNTKWVGYAWAFAIAATAGTASAEKKIDQAMELVAEARELMVVGACGDGASPKVDAGHCKKVKAAQADYQSKWMAKANPFFAAAVPTSGIPRPVVYPFGGGDLATALTVFPDAPEITTLSLEPAGDVRALAAMSDKQLRTALATIEKDLGSLYRSTFSRTMDMTHGLGRNELPTILVFTLSALAVHGYEPVALRYFQLTDDGNVRYLTEADFTRIDAIKEHVRRANELGSIELVYKKPGEKRERVYRHIVANLDDPHLKTSPAALRHLEKKGHVTAMTKAASFLLTFDEFSTMRKYIVDHVDWMVSDATGLAPKWGKPAGFEYETYGRFDRSEMDVGIGISPSWIAEYKAQPARKLEFRFGYPDVNYHHNLVIMRRTTKAAAR